MCGVVFAAPDATTALCRRMTTLFWRKHVEKVDLHSLLVEELKDLYSAENQLIKALPKMAKATTNAKLKTGFEKHLEQTKGHAVRIEQVCKELEETPKGAKCKAMEGLVAEGSEMIDDHDAGDTLDAGLIAAAQKVEHYEIASYGTVICWAKTLGLTAIASTLEKTLNEEKKTDEDLTALAELTINIAAEKA